MVSVVGAMVELVEALGHIHPVVRDGMVMEPVVAEGAVRLIGVAAPLCCCKQPLQEEVQLF
eukprot:1809614-Heterocapsa_arctica.AAC.1